MKVHKITLLVVDHDDLGAEDVAREIEAARFPNDCVHPRVMAMETRETEWSDEHPLNNARSVRAEFEKLFNLR